MAKVSAKDFYPVAYAGMLGGAAHFVSDSFLATVLPTDLIESLGISIKDIALIYLGVYAEKNHAKKAWQKDACTGMSIIAVYKTLYPKFLEPTVHDLTKDWFGGGA